MQLAQIDHHLIGSTELGAGPHAAVSRLLPFRGGNCIRGATKTRRPKPETRKKAEIRRPKPAAPLQPPERDDPGRGFRPASGPESTSFREWPVSSSDFGSRPSFGFRYSGFGSPQPRPRPFRMS